MPETSVGKIIEALVFDEHAHMKQKIDCRGDRCIVGSLEVSRKVLIGLWYPRYLCL